MQQHANQVPANVMIIKSVVDGIESLNADDGYGNGDPDSPNQGRRRIMRLFDKKAPDGGPLFYVLRPLTGWSSGSKSFEPIPRAPVWDETAQKRHKRFLIERAEKKRAAAERVQAGEFSRSIYTERLRDARARAAEDRARRAEGEAAAASAPTAGDDELRIRAAELEAKLEEAQEALAAERARAEARDRELEHRFGDLEAKLAAATKLLEAATAKVDDKAEASASTAKSDDKAEDAKKKNGK